MAVEWDEEHDVVVFGGGGSGLRAALAAADAGAKVALYEKNEELGGKTAMSIGIMTASGSPPQKDAGIEDSHANHLADIKAMAERAGTQIDEAATLFMVRECSRELQELLAMGFAFSGPHPEGPHGTARMHVIQPDPRHLVERLIDECRNRSVSLHARSPGRDLLLDHEGRVVGGVVQTQDGMKRLKAGAIVLAAGDYSANASLVKQVAPDADMAEPLSIFAMGDGHLMALRIGARTQNMARINTPHLRFTDWPHVEPSPGLFRAGAVLVSEKGHLIDLNLAESAELQGVDDVREDYYIVIDQGCTERLAKAMDDVGPGRDGWMRTGKPFVGTAPAVGYAYLEDCAGWDWYLACPSLDEVAKHIGCAVDALVRAADGLGPGPFHVLGPARRVLANSGGGLTTNRKMNVLGRNGRPIKGLYGGGVNARLISFMGGHGYALAWAMASGRIAGREAARYVNVSGPR